MPAFDAGGSNVVFVIGRNQNVGAGPEDIVSWGGLATFPTVMAATTVVSSDPNDTVFGTGLQRVVIQGIDDDYREVTQIVDLDGTTPVSLPLDLMFVNNMSGDNVGTVDGTNIGNIDVLHGATILNQIAAGVGLSQASIFIIPSNYRYAELHNVFFNATKSIGVETDIVVSFETSMAGKAWLQRFKYDIKTNIKPTGVGDLDTPVKLSPRLRLRCRVLNATAVNTMIDTGFELKLVR